MLGKLVVVRIFVQGLIPSLVGNPISNSVLFRSQSINYLL